MEVLEEHLHMVPDVKRAEACIGLSKDHKVILVELIGLHRHRLEMEGFINCEIYREGERERERERERELLPAHKLKSSPLPFEVTEPDHVR